MVDMIFLEIALAFVIVATVAAVATTSASRTVRGVAIKTVNGSLTAALGGADRLVLLLAAGIELQGDEGLRVLVGSPSIAGRPQGAKHPWPRMKL